MIKTFAILLTLFLSQYVYAGCVEIQGKHYCGGGECVVVDGVAYCAPNEFGKALVHDGVALCGAGSCLEHDGNVYCSQFPGGDIIEHDHALWSGPGACIVHDANVYCAQKPRGKCFVVDGTVRCEGDWVRDTPSLAEPCPRALGID